MNYMINAQALRERLINIDPECTIECAYDAYERAEVKGVFMGVPGVLIVIGPFDECGAAGYEAQLYIQEHDFTACEITTSADKALVNLGMLIEWAKSYSEAHLTKE